MAARESNMPKIQRTELQRFTREILVAKDVADDVAHQVAESLVLGNLRGHDSHGVIRIIQYVDWMDRGWVNPKGRIQVVKDSGSILIVDGEYQFGQVIGRQATSMAIDKAKQEGVCVLTIRHSSHLGRIGEFMEMAAAAGVVSLSLTNTHGGGVLAAPYGGREPRLSANPIAGGAPVRGGAAIVMDMATCVIAEGKVKVAQIQGEKLPPNCVVDGQGNPTTDPDAYYADPPGAILPLAGHKGYALSVFAEILAGAVGGGSCSHANREQIANGWFAVFIDPAAFCGGEFYDEQTSALVQWVKSSETMQGFDEVLVPGEPERRATLERSTQGIPIDDQTLIELDKVADRLFVPTLRREKE